MKKKEIPVSLVMLTFEIDKTEPAIRNALEQDYPNKEIIVVNDNPKLKIPDSILKLEKQRKIKIVNNVKNLGMAGSLNAGIKASKTNTILFTCHDYFFESNQWIRHIVEKLYSDKKLGTIGSVVRLPIEEWKNYSFLNKLFTFRHMLKPSRNLHSCYKREVFNKLGLFDSKNFKRGGEDGDFYSKVIKAGYKTGCIEDSLIHKHYNKDDSLLKILRKEYEYGRSHGARKRKDGLFSRLGLFDFEIRILLILGFIMGLFIHPIISFLYFLPFFFVALFKCIKAYPQTKWIPGLILSPFAGVLILLIQTIGATKEYLVLPKTKSKK